ncbi:hypothetical protein Dimus_008482 [Dionaea muscipula]
MWSYDSAKHLDLRVRSVVERAMREGLGSVEADLGPDKTEVTEVVSPCEGLDPIENFDPDLKASSEGLSLTMEAALPDMSPVGFEDRGCEEALGMTTISETLSDGVDSEKREGLLVTVRLLRLTRRRPGAVGLASSATSAGGGHSDSTLAS